MFVSMFVSMLKTLNWIDDIWDRKVSINEKNSQVLFLSEFKLF